MMFALFDGPATIDTKSASWMLIVWGPPDCSCVVLLAAMTSTFPNAVTFIDPFVETVVSEIRIAADPAGEPTVPLREMLPRSANTDAPDAVVNGPTNMP